MMMIKKNSENKNVNINAGLKWNKQRAKPTRKVRCLIY